MPLTAEEKARIVEEEQLRQSVRESLASNQPTPWRRPMAALWSLLIPGAGQIYKGFVGSGIAWIILVVAGYSVMMSLGAVLHIICIVSAYYGRSKDEVKRARSRRWGKAPQDISSAQKL